MTTWQDKQPNSRRALRENERKHAQAVLSEQHEAELEEQNSDQQIWNPPTGPEPLTYVTKGRESAPQTVPGSRRARSAPPIQPVPDTGSYRLRDFSPESRGASFSATQPTPAKPWTRASSGGGDLNYHTAAGIDRGEQTPHNAPVGSPPDLGTVENEVRPPAVAEKSVPSDATMTRREMRALRDAAGASPQVLSAPGQFSEPDALAADDGLVEADAVVATDAVVAAAAAAEPDALLPGAQSPDTQLPEGLPEVELKQDEPAEIEPPPSALVPPAALPVAANFDLVQPDVRHPRSPVAPEAENNVELVTAMAEFDTLYQGRIAQPQADSLEPPLEPVAWQEAPLAEVAPVAPVAAEPEAAEPEVAEPEPAKPEAVEPEPLEPIVSLPVAPPTIAPAAEDTPIAPRRNRRASSPPPPTVSERATATPPPVIIIAEASTTVSDEAMDALVAAAPSQSTASPASMAQPEPVAPSEPAARSELPAPTASPVPFVSPPQSGSSAWPSIAGATDADQARVEPRADAPTPSALEREIVIAPEMSNRPLGHWSTQAGIDDKLQAGDHTMSRNLAAIDAITTNALVLPNFPTSAPVTGPVGNTGEILITGSIDLPRTMGVSGLHPARYDHADVDLLDKSDREDAAPDSAPVRAIRAVSTHTSSQGLIATKRPKGNNLPVILSITAGVMMVGVVVLVVAGMVFKIF